MPADRSTAASTCRSSKLKVEIARILKENNYIQDFSRRWTTAGRLLRLFLKYAGATSR